MIFNTPSIILVDNEVKELNQLRDAFFAAGMPCLPIQYIFSDDNSGLDHIEIPYNLIVRFLFLDLHLVSEDILHPKEYVGHIKKVIEKFITAGPYMLIFWSKYRDEPNEVVRLLEERFSDQIILPLAWHILDKTEFIEGSEPKTDKESLFKLRDKIKDVAKDRAIFRALLEWEGLVSLAACDTLKCLNDLAKPNEEYNIENHHINLKRIIQRIAKEAAGENIVKEKPANAVKSGLFPLLADRLYQKTEIEDYNQIWKDALNDIDSTSVINPKVLAKLNTFYLLDINRGGFVPETRGAFFEICENFDQEKKLAKHFGKTKEQLLFDFFNETKKVKGSNIIEAKKKTKVGFLEISPACDHAQDKIGLHRYILGALIPEKYGDFCSFGRGKPKHEGIYVFPDIVLDSKKYLVRLNFKYQIGVSTNSELYGEVMFRVREEILSHIIFHCSQYSSRPGILSFK